jgi:hypothetical protein
MSEQICTLAAGFGAIAAARIGGRERITAQNTGSENRLRVLISMQLRTATIRAGEAWATLRLDLHRVMADQAIRRAADAGFFALIMFACGSCVIDHTFYCKWDLSECLLVI